MTEYKIGWDIGMNGPGPGVTENTIIHQTKKRRKERILLNWHNNDSEGFFLLQTNGSLFQPQSESIINSVNKFLTFKSIRCIDKIYTKVSFRKEKGICSSLIIVNLDAKQHQSGRVLDFTVC